ncbi:MAG TPA: hypothetical protein VFE53_09830 [Mucilaginibacter sp.]|jgi:hypothetical protein|nr:hypothetical protein [Mucilaginibacter sp.]
MKKIFPLICFLVILQGFARAQSEWVDYKIDAKLSIKMPEAPTNADDYSVIAMTKDSMVCVITKIDMQKVAGLDSAALAGLATTEDFTNSVKTGMQEKMQGYALGDVKTSKWNNYYAYSIDGANTATRVKSFTFMIIIGDYLYSISAVMPQDKNTQPKDDFFASLKLN